jgi:hypothetical protein
MNSNWLIRALPSWEKNHARLWAPLRVAIGVWLLILTAILYGYDRGGWWGALLIPAAALHFYVAYRLHRLPRAAGANPGAK